jgi:hypothetical protein
MEAEAPTYAGDEDKTGTKATTPSNGSTARVGEARKDPVDLYYELHGSGPHKVLLIMGTLVSFSSPSYLCRLAVLTDKIRVTRICHVEQGLAAHGTGVVGARHIPRGTHCSYSGTACRSTRW